MKIQCDVCEKAPATLICCADEAALCGKCDVEVHAANKLASKHQRLILQTHNLSNNLPPRCDICQEKVAFIFCVEDRALFCRDCDIPIHSAGSLAANHQRFLATGIRVGLSSISTKETEKSNQEPPPAPTMTATVPNAVPVKAPAHQISSYGSPAWAVDDLLQFSDIQSPDKKENLEFEELEWLTDYGVFCDEVPEVPQLPAFQPINTASHRQTKLYVPSNKKPKYETPYIEDDDEHFTVPDLG